MGLNFFKSRGSRLGLQIDLFLCRSSASWLQFILLRISSVTSLAPSVWYCWTIKSTVLILSAASSRQTGIGSDRRLRRRWKVFKSSFPREFNILSSRIVTSTDSETQTDTAETTTMVTLDSNWLHQIYKDHNNGYTRFTETTTLVTPGLRWITHHQHHNFFI